MAEKKLTIENFEITGVSAFNNPKFEGIQFNWIANIGFGSYTIYKDKEDNKWYIDDECLDNKERKFGRLVLDQFLRDIDSGKSYGEDDNDEQMG